MAPDPSLAPPRASRPPSSDPEHKRVTIWNRRQGRKIAGNAAPLSKNLDDYLRKHPYCERYDGQDRATRYTTHRRILPVGAHAAQPQQVLRATPVYLHPSQFATALVPASAALDARGHPVRVPALIPISAPMHIAAAGPVDGQALQQREPVLIYGAPPTHPAAPAQQQPQQQQPAVSQQQQHSPQQHPARPLQTVAYNLHGQPVSSASLPTSLQGQVHLSAAVGQRPHELPKGDAKLSSKPSTQVASGPRLEGGFFQEHHGAAFGLPDAAANAVSEKNARAQAQIAVANAQAQARAQVRRQQQAVAVEQQQQHQQQQQQQQQQQHLQNGHVAGEEQQQPPQGKAVDVASAAALHQHLQQQQHKAALSAANGQLSPAQFFVDMKAMIEVQQKTVQQNRVQVLMSPSQQQVSQQQHEQQMQQQPKKESVSAAMPPPQFTHQQGVFDVDAATYQLAGTRIDGEDANAAALQRQGAYDNSAIMHSVSRDMDVGAPGNAFSENAGDVAGLPNGSLHQQEDHEGRKNARKERADHVDNLLNSAGGASAMSTHPFTSPANSQTFDAFRLANGRLPSSMSRTFSFLMKGGPLTSRESSMEFRRNNLNGGKRDMSIEILRRDFSMELVNHAKKPSRDMLEGELPRDMSIDFFGKALSHVNRDFSMEMQFPQNPNAGQRGAAVELGAFDDGVDYAGLSFAHAQQSRDDLSKELASIGAGPNGEHQRHGGVMRSKIGRSQDDLMLHGLGNTTPMPIHRRGINGSIEDFREFTHPF